MTPGPAKPILERLGVPPLRVKTSRFEYGSEKMTLYNVGYPLHRLVEGGAAATAGTELGEARELTLRVVPRRKRRAC